MASFYFWAQNLDNSSPDHIFIDTNELDPIKQSAKRKEIVTLVSKITANIKPRIVGEYVKIYLGEDNFVLTAILPDPDVLKRKSPVLCYGELANPDDESFSNEAFSLISNFIEKINRTFPSEIEKEVKQALRVAKKKPLLQRKTAIVAILLFFVLLFLAFLCIYFIGKPG